MPVLQFKGKTAIECYHHTVPHHTLEFDCKLSVLDKAEKPGVNGNLIIVETKGVGTPYPNDLRQHASALDFSRASYLGLQE